MATKKETEAIENAAIEEPKEKLVKVRIPRTKKDDPDVYIGVNERTWLIKRGVEVEVPECVAEVLQHQEEMLALAYDFEDSIKH